MKTPFPLIMLLVMVTIFQLTSCSGTGDSSEKEAESSQPKSLESLGIDESAGIPEGLQVGQQSPGFGTKDVNGNSIDLYGITRDSKVVLVFYRGSWCPWCTKHMANLSDSVQYILGKGARVIAVTPENRQLTSQFTDSLRTGINVIADTRNAIMNAFKVTFTVNDSYLQKLMEGIELDLAANNNSEEARLPVPATFIIDNTGTIVWRHFDLDYRKRPTVKKILEQL